jgi:L-threonylcarbamoyladenylate synthase
MNQYPSVYKLNDRTFRRCKRLIQSGELVAFPTETVYGLGANALDTKAVSKIFEWKGRPNSNPIIVHFSKLSQLEQITNLSNFEKNVMLILANSFWPGPITLVLRASNIVPKQITAGKEFVGVRMPDDSVARKLIDESKCFIAAPSANISGHCSPYSMEHVLNDFYNRNLCILDDSENRNLRYGIESTVIKLEEKLKSTINISILRTGIIGGNKIKKLLELNGIKFNIEYFERKCDESIAMDCPGQLFRHYAPIIPAYIEHKNSNLKVRCSSLKKYVIISANNSLIKYKDKCLKFLDLGSTLIEVAKNIYSILRLAEKCIGAIGIIVSIKNLDELKDEDTDIDLAIHDKLSRCSEGNFIKIIK